MKKIWHQLSYRGLEDSKLTLENRTFILSNRINGVLIVFLFLLGIIQLYTYSLDSGKVSILTYRIFILLGINLFLYYIAKYQLFNLIKISLIFLPVFVIIILPAFLGKIEEESFYYYPIVIIAFSLVPQLLYRRKKHSLFFWISILPFLLILIFLYNFLTHFSSNDFVSIPLIAHFQFYYTFVPVIAFFFMHMSISYLSDLNVGFENEILEFNEELNSTLEKLKNTQQHLFHSEKMAAIGTLTAGVAHEINNPLNFIGGGIELLSEAKEDLENKLDEEMKEQFHMSLNMISEGFHRTTAIVKALSNFANNGNSKLMEVDINVVIDDTLLFLNSKLKHNIKVNKKYELAENVYVYKDKLHQIFFSLIENAEYALNKITGDKWLRISTAKQNDFVIIQFENNGEKIKPDLMSAIFEPFFTTKEQGEGKGLGLSIAYHLISEHKGTIQVDNTNFGVCFTMKLPLLKSIN